MAMTRDDRERFSALYLDGGTYEELAEKFGVTERYARILRDRLGLPKRVVSHKARSAPDGFAEYVSANGVTAARTHYKASWGTVYRWASENGIKVKRKRIQNKRPPKLVAVPDDWAEMAPNMYIYELMDHYGLTVLMVKRLIELTGINSKPTVHQLAKERGPKPKKSVWVKRRPQTFTGYKHWHSGIAFRPSDPYSMAADFLRRFFSNVHRCDILMREFSKETWGHAHGVPNGGRGYYFVGGLGVVTKENMLSIAEQKGFTYDSGVAVA